MATVVIGGHSRKVGKTSVVAGLIIALPDLNWTAIKISQHLHVVGDDQTWSIAEERNRSGKSDSSRFLQAGAVRVWWVRTDQIQLAEAIPTIQSRIAEAQNVIVESNSILKFICPDVYITVLDPATTDFKASAEEFLDRADAVILHEHGGNGKVAWEGISLNSGSGRPIFRIKPPEYVSAEIAEFVRWKIAQSMRT